MTDTRAKPCAGLLMALMLGAGLGLGATLEGASLLGQQGRPARGAQEAYALAAGLHDRGFHERAVAAFDAFLKAHPEDTRRGRATFFRAESLLALGREARALQAFARAIAGGGELEALARSRAGELAGRAARHEDALRFLAPLKAEGTEASLRVPALYWSAEAALALGRSAEARRDHMRLLKDHDQDPLADWAALSLGRMEASAADPARAIAPLKRALKAQEADLAGEAAVLLGDLHLRRGEVQESLSAFNAALTRDSGRWEQALRSGRIHAWGSCEAGCPVPAEEAIRESHALLAQDTSERSLSAVLALAQAFDSQQQAEPVLKLLTRWPKESGELGLEAAYWAGVAALQTGDAEAAHAQLARAVRSGSPHAQHALGSAELLLGRPDAAAAAFSAVLSSEADASLRTESALALAELEFQRQGMEAVLAALKALPARGEQGGGLAEAQRVAATRLAAEALRALQRYPEAVRAFEEHLACPLEDAARAAAVYRAAWCERASGKPKRARERLDAWLSGRAPHPDDGPARYLQGLVLQELGEEQAAAAVFKDLSTSGEGGLAGRAALAGAAVSAKAGDAEAALAAAERAVEAAPDQSMRRAALEAMAVALDELQRFAESRQAWARLAAAAQDQPLVAARAALGEGWACRRLGEAEPALRCAQRALAVEDPQLLGEAHHLRGLSAAALGQNETALEAFDAVLGLRPQHARRGEAGLFAAVSLRRLQRAEEASARLKALIAAKPEGLDLALANRELARSLPAGPERVEALRRVLRSGAGQGAAEAHFALGEEAYAQGEDERALGHYAQALESAGAKGLMDAISYKQGYALLRLKRHAEAGDAFARAARVESSPLAREARLRAGEAFAKAGRHAEALAALDAVLAAAEGDALEAGAQWQRIAVLGALGRHAEAVAAATPLLAREQDPAIRLILAHELGRSAAALERPALAREAWTIVTRLDNGEAGSAAQLSIARSLLEQGQGDAALAAYLEVSILYRHPPAVRTALSEAAAWLDAQGRGAEAKRLREELVRDHADSAEGRAAAKALKTEKSKKSPRASTATGGDAQ